MPETLSTCNGTSQLLTYVLTMVSCSDLFVCFLLLCNDVTVTRNNITCY